MRVKMKIFYSLICLLIFLSIEIYSQSIEAEPKGLDKVDKIKRKLQRFRSVNFGLTKAEVKKLETETFLKEEKFSNYDVLIYEGVVAGLKTDIWYIFIKDEFVNGSYFFVESHTNDNLYIDDYKHVKNIITDKYGKPQTELADWNDDLYRDDPDRYGFAVSLGDLVYSSMWEFENGYILDRLSGDNYDIKHNVQYRLNKFDQYLKDIKKSSSDF